MKTRSDVPTKFWTRRSFLTAAIASGLGLVTSGCGTSSDNLRVRLLKGSVPLQLVGQFKRSLPPPPTTQLSVAPQIADNFERLRTWKSAQQTTVKTMGLFPWQQEPLANLVTLGDAWLTAAIRQELLHPIDPSTWQNWSAIPQTWQAIVQRDQDGLLADNGEIWGAPYRWGTTVLAYRDDAFKQLGWQPTDWSDLWRPELERHIGLLDQPREVIGLVLKSLGKSYNTAKPTAVSGLRKQLRSLQNQALFFSSDYYLQPLLLDDVWLTVGWSTDILPLLAYDSNIRIVTPQSGTALWSDVWVQPRDSIGHVEAIRQWVEFYWQPDIALQFPRLGDANSPVNVGLPPDTIPEDIAHRQILFPPEEILAKSEFIQPLPVESEQQYRSLWQQMRTQTL